MSRFTAALDKVFSGGFSEEQAEAYTAGATAFSDKASYFTLKDIEELRLTQNLEDFLDAYVNLLRQRLIEEAIGDIEEFIRSLARLFELDGNNYEEFRDTLLAAWDEQFNQADSTTEPNDQPRRRIQPGAAIGSVLDYQIKPFGPGVDDYGRRKRRTKEEEES